MQAPAHTSLHAHAASIPDGRVDWSGPDGRIAACCSLWWRGTPPFGEHRLGLIGEYSTTDRVAGEQVLDRACQELAAQGCTLAIGPLDGSTWRRYRFVTETDGRPPFFLEPDNPPEWPLQFEAFGFKPLATYCSSLVEALDQEPPKARLAEQRLAARGVRLCSLDPSHWDTFLQAAYQVSAVCFQKGFLYQPLPEEAFLKMYEQIRPHVRSELVLFALQDEQPVGFVFSLPDVLEARGGGAIQTVILKTLAVLPGRELAGLGWVLTQQTHRVARELGYRRVIHALMHDSNVSLNISAHYGRAFRRYALYSKPL